MGPGRDGTSYLTDLMKLAQFEGFYPKLIQSKFKEICLKPGEVDHPLVFFFFFWNKND